MNLRKLYHTIDTLVSQTFENEETLLKHVLQEVVKNEEIGIHGGRIWKFFSDTGSYHLVHQTGAIEPVKANYRLRVSDYPIFLELTRLHTVLRIEEIKYLRKKGILKYSATGVGKKIRWKGDTLYQYILAFSVDELGENVKATLNIIGASLNALLRSNTIEDTKNVFERDLDKAGEIQARILPRSALQFHSYDLYGVSVPDRIVGGDFFDYLTVEGDNERLGVVIGDATSKGIAAAVEALYVSGALRLGFQYQSKISVLLSQVNKLLHRTFANDHFITLFYAELTEGTNGLVIYANCGHHNPLLLRAGATEVEHLEATGQILGPFRDEIFKTEGILMQAGDILLLYTDGITEACNEQGEFYGEERLASTLIENRGRSPKEITEQILLDVQAFSALGRPLDDRTLVAILRQPGHVEKREEESPNSPTPLLL
ncbi:MAG TPA: PP2C family protein-serine/threonine phosphatase [Bacteroidota bacterium]|nr:PP2C family protein-serine/threonine phosphatase [Bacteroidota bacterium]